jgi:hypothetical protein
VRASSSRAALDFVALGLIGVALTWPLLRDPSETLPDAWFAYTQVWTLDVMTEGLLQGRLVGPTDQLAWPHGGYLAIVGWSYLPWLLLLRGLGLGTVVATNTGIWLQLVMAAFLCYLLLRRLGAGRGASLMAGAIYGFHPFAFHQLAYGQLSELCHWGLPAVALLLPRALERWRPWTTLAYGLVFGLALASSPYAGIGAMVLSALLGLWWLVRNVADERRAGALRLAVAALASLLGSLPFLLYYFVLARGQECLLRPNSLPNLPIWDNNFITASLAGWLLPARLFEPAPGPWDAALHGASQPLPEHAIGVVSLLLMGAALLWARKTTMPVPRRPGRLAWLLVAVVYWLIATGWKMPLHPGSETVLPAPLAFLWTCIPQLRFFAAPYRLAAGVLLAASVLTGLALHDLQARLGETRGRLLLSAALLAGVAESVLASSTPRPLALMDTHTPAVYRELASMDEGAVLTIPWWPTFSDPKPTKILFWQTIHGHPIHHGEGAAPSEAHLTAFVHDLQRIRGAPSPVEPSETELHTTWIVVHEASLSREELGPVTAQVMEHAQLERRYPEEAIALYRARRPDGGDP